MTEAAAGRGGGRPGFGMWWRLARWSTLIRRHRTRWRLVLHRHPVTVGISGGRAGGGDRWQIGSPRKASAATWPREDFVRQGSVEQNSVEGVGGDVNPGGGQAMGIGGGRAGGDGRSVRQRTAPRLIGRGALMAERFPASRVRERNLGEARWESEREGDGPCGAEGGGIRRLREVGGGIDPHRWDFTEMI
ncbi:Os08g0564850 [Oryza sativa Japonica Group]|uniref:Os08g0564850 protein n=1 Tax=Oryza sativa subsp. japonica TaxID=39947 RepID=A0A0P0XIE6_ORYSJ|nr:Os08g0564850 [Oryza sativa Japonica Group]